jgi:sulfatase modifying factor 1
MSGIIAKNGGAKAWIPSDSEWYNAAYFDPTKNAGAGGYWQHANQSDSMTTNDIGVAGAANYYDGNGYATYVGGSSWGITDGGAYGANSDSYYGTNDQAGNVWEWNDAVISGISGPSRLLRGGAWTGNAAGLHASTRNTNDPTNEDAVVGFRVASVPEPASLLLTMLAGGVLMIRRKM